MKSVPFEFSITTPSGDNIIFPYVQDFLIDQKFLQMKGEAAEGPYATTFRHSHNIVTLTGIEPHAPSDNREVFQKWNLTTILDSLERETSRQDLSIFSSKENFSILRISHDNNLYIKMFCILRDHTIIRDVTSPLIRSYTFSFLGSEEPMALNGYLTSNISGRMTVPITSGKWQI